MKALVIEDDESLRSLFALCLERMGFRTEEACNSAEAIGKIDETDYDIILSDIHMPGGDGKSLYRLISRHAPELLGRLIFATGNPADEDFYRFSSSIACPVLCKPFSLALLRKTVQKILKKRVTHHPSPVCAS